MADTTMDSSSRTTPLHPVNHHQHPVVNKAMLPAFRPSIQLSSSDEYEFCGVIGPTNVEGMIACPCCNRPRNEVRETLNEPIVTIRSSLFSDSSSSDEGDDDNHNDEEDVLPGVLARGIEYHPKRILVEGWVHKKGTGNDFFGSRSWKPRWARLALAKVAGYEMDIPLLLIYWYRSSSVPSTVILLESTVVLAIDKEDPKQWNACRFEIRHVKQTDNNEVQATRTFTVPKTERDMWVNAISKALLVYEKQKAKARKSGTIPMMVAEHDSASLSSPVGSPRTATMMMENSRPWSPVHDSICLGDQFVSWDKPPPNGSARRLSSPPSSPRPASKRPLPRHDFLAGESLA